MARIEPEWVRIRVTNHAQTSLHSALALDGPGGDRRRSDRQRGSTARAVPALEPVPAVPVENARPHCTTRATLAGSEPRAAGSEPAPKASAARSEEHTSELQSLRHLVCR